MNTQAIQSIIAEMRERAERIRNEPDYLGAPEGSASLDDFAEQIESALTAQPAEGVWREIESAPKHEAVLAGKDNWPIPMILMWLDGYATQVAGPGWYGIDGGDWSSRTFAPTHWQPLPAPPAAARSEGE